MGCPLDAVCDKGMGAALMTKPSRLHELLVRSSALLGSMGVPLTLKVRRPGCFPAPPSLFVLIACCTCVFP